MVYQHPQNPGKYWAVARVSERRPHFLFWAAIIILVGSLANALFVTRATAATRASGDTYTALLNDKQMRTVGYQISWQEKLSDVAMKAYKNGDFPMARRTWLTLAEQGDADAAYRLGMLYDMGEGIKQDSAEAAFWYLKAARAGNLNAQHNLAVAYASGDGVELDISKALAWWKRAAQFGNPDSQYNLGIIYAMGVHGVKKNLDQAKKWWRMAAINGDPMAQFNLGTIYANGDGHVKSYCEAMRWWEKSAQRGVQQASWALEVIQTRQDYLACW